MKKKLLFLTVKFDTGGTEKVTYDIITRLNPEKYDITLMSMYGGGYYWDHLPAHIHREYFFPRFIRYVIRYVTLFPGKLVYKTFIRKKYDVEIACGDDIPSRVINHSSNPASKKVSWIHMDVQQRGYQGYEMKTQKGREQFYKNFDHIVNVSYECERKFKEKFGAFLPTCVIYNPVPADEILTKGNVASTYLLNTNTFNIVCMGRFTPQKGFDRMLDAIRVLKTHNISNFHVTILGDGNERPHLEQCVRKYGLEDTVSMPGHVENPYAIIRQADLFALPSRDESFSLAVAEAMVLGIPVMSTRCTGPTELLQNGRFGCLVENSTDGILQGLKQILTDPQYYHDLLSLAQANTALFDIHKQLTEVEALFDSSRS